MRTILMDLMTRFIFMKKNISCLAFDDLIQDSTRLFLVFVTVGFQSWARDNFLATRQQQCDNVT